MSLQFPLKKDPILSVSSVKVGWREFITVIPQDPEAVSYLAAGTKYLTRKQLKGGKLCVGLRSERMQSAVVGKATEWEAVCLHLGQSGHRKMSAGIQLAPFSIFIQSRTLAIVWCYLHSG